MTKIVQSNRRPNSVPMGPLFDACEAVLDARIAPVHYKELTRLALNSMCREVDDKQFSRSAEDVREKLLDCHSGRDVMYVSHPFFCGMRRSWIHPQRNLFQTTSKEIVIAPRVDWSVTAAFEALMRKDHMLTKVVNSERRFKAMARGFQIEKHVQGWFRENYPEAYLHPDNEGIWHRPCDHDFKLAIGDGIYRKVDVMGPNGDTEEFFLSRGKRPVDIHVFAVYDATAFRIVGFAQRQRFGWMDSIRPDVMSSLDSLLFILNCSRLDKEKGFPCGTFYRAALRTSP